MRAGRSRRLLGLAGLAGFVVLLELLPRSGLVPERYLPPASRIAGALAAELDEPAFWALGDTLEGWAVGLVLAVAAELVIGSPGLGREIAVAQTSGAVPSMYALVVVAGLLGVGVNLAARALERRVLAWHPSVRREVAG